MWLLMIPLIVLLLVVFGLATVGVAIHLLWAAWPVVLILMGIWLLTHNHHHARHAWRWYGDEARAGGEERARAPQQAPEPSAPGGATRPPATSRLPRDVEAKVEQIRQKADTLLRQPDRFPPFSQDVYVVQQIASDYLPRTIDAYLSLPPDDAYWSTQGTGKTALQELKDQLALLESKLDEIARDIDRRDVDRLVANRRFLEDRFGRANA